MLVEFNPSFCRLLRTRYPDATVIQGDAYRIQHLLGGLLREPAAAVVSGLPLKTKPFKQRLRLIDEAFELMAPDAPFVQFTYAMVTPIPKRPADVAAHALRADLAEPAAGAGVGLSQELSPCIDRRVVMAGSPGHGRLGPALTVYGACAVRCFGC